MARPLRIEYPGAVYHVITRGNNRQKIFRDDDDRKGYLKKLIHYCQVKAAELLCYCLQSNHVHLLLATPKGNLSKLMQPFQTSYTMYFNRRHRHSGHVFEQRYKAFLVDKDNYLLQVSRYIHLNPVEAGLVHRPQDHRWSSYGGYVGGNTATGLNTSLVLDQMGGKKPEQIQRYREYVEGEKQGGKVDFTLPTIKQSIVGGEEFAERVFKEVRKKAETNRAATLAEIEEVVCRLGKVDKEMLRRPLRSMAVKRGRELFMYVARHHTRASLREIADRMGVRDISTVSHAERRVATQLTEPDAKAKELRQYLKKIYSSIQA